jgi:hypothetical protein
VLNQADIDEIVTHTRRLRVRFAATAPRPWDAMTASAELAVQLGHVALCELAARDHVGDLRDPGRPIENLGDELADVVLAASSIAVLSGTQPSLIGGPGTGTAEGADEVLALLVRAGSLVETAMVDQRYRHAPEGARVSVAQACGQVLAVCQRMAATHGLDLMSEFGAMVDDADAFLETVSPAACSVKVVQ